ncbi:MAG: FtsQ-type POTRA domain-containing protein [Desulfotomaculum sp.]|nr:FtsQ-type POTRA domain-containing protein [Desulfotomaculum sp.]
MSVYVLLQSPVFNVKKIEIIGREKIPREKIIELSGVVLGSNIFKLDLHSGEKKISLLPAVKNVEITRRFPSTIVITVTERRPVALLPVEEGFAELDREGIFLRKAEFIQSSFPVITGGDVPGVKPGQKVRNNAVITALTVIDKLPAQLTKQLSEVHVDTKNEVTIYTINGIQGRMGMPENIRQKGSVFLKVLEQIGEEQKIEYIDLTSCKSPVVKYAEN